MGKCQEVLVSSQLVLKIKVHYSLLNSQKNKRKNSLVQLTKLFFLLRLNLIWGKNLWDEDSPSSHNRYNIIYYLVNKSLYQKDHVIPSTNYVQ